MADDYDPGSPFDDFDSRRARRRQRNQMMRDNEIDDAWAAADSDDVPDDAVELEDLAAGYVDDEAMNRRPEDDDLPITPDLGPLPESARMVAQRRRTSAPVQLDQHTARDAAYAKSPSYHQSSQNVVDRVLGRMLGDTPYARTEGGYSRELYRNPGGVLSHLPFWGIVILVILAVMALMAVILACAAMVVLLR
jgi:hypothetical protein